MHKWTVKRVTYSFMLPNVTQKLHICLNIVTVWCIKLFYCANV